MGKKMTEAQDKAYDKKHGLKEGSMADYKQDRKHGMSKKEAMKGMSEANKKKVKGTK